LHFFSSAEIIFDTARTGKAHLNPSTKPHLIACAKGKADLLIFSLLLLSVDRKGEQKARWLTQKTSDCQVHRKES